jgi:hypothetical protein
MTIFLPFRMESKEKCEQIIQMFNGSPLAGSKEPLLVKFADGGIKKRNIYKSQDQRMWKDGGEVSCITCICLRYWETFSVAVTLCVDGYLRSENMELVTFELSGECVGQVCTRQFMK